MVLTSLTNLDLSQQPI